MAINIKDQETDALVRELAMSRGLGITDAIKAAAREALEADRRAKTFRPLRERVRPILDGLDRLPRSDVRTDKQFFDELWGE